MYLKPFPYKNLPFSKLFQTYVNDFKEISEFYEANPFNPDKFPAKADSLKYEGNRKQLVSLLQRFNEPFEPHNAAVNNIERFGNSRSLALVTGQQLGLYGGPVYTIFKTLTVIHLAEKLEKQLSRPVIPVFWLADEDHDYDEIRTIHLPGNDGTADFSLPPLEQPHPPVSNISLPDEIETLSSNIRSNLIDTDFTDDLWPLLDDCFCPGASFRDAFGRFITRLFSQHGLVLAGSQDKSIKEYLKEGFIQSVKKADAIYQQLEDQSRKIDQTFHRQAAVMKSHLFFLHPERGRQKIHHQDNIWTTDAGQEWSDDELIDEIDANPGLFSPDVFLRPVLQDQLLPVFGYVAGPGETAYYGQMKSAYHAFGQKMPVIFPRMSATFMEPAIDRILDELPFDLAEYNQRIEDLETKYVERAGELDIESIFGNWKKGEQSVAAKQIEKITAIDETLEGAAKSAQSAYHNELNKLKGKVYQAEKKQKNIQLNRIRRIRQNLFPDRELQERTFCGIYYMNKFGPDIWDRLLAELSNSDIDLDTHQIIYL